MLATLGSLLALALATVLIRHRNSVAAVLPRLYRVTCTGATTPGRGRAGVRGFSPRTWCCTCTTRGGREAEPCPPRRSSWWRRGLWTCSESWSSTSSRPSTATPDPEVGEFYPPATTVRRTSSLRLCADEQRNWRRPWRRRTTGQRIRQILNTHAYACCLCSHLLSIQIAKEFSTYNSEFEIAPLSCADS